MPFRMFGCITTLLLALLMVSFSHAGELTLEEAIQRTLVLQADIIYSKLSHDSSRSAYQGKAGYFDNNLSSSISYTSSESPFGSAAKSAYGLDYHETKTQSYDLSLKKLSRSGIEFEASATYEDVEDVNLYDIDDVTTTLGLSIKFPIYDLLMENVYTTSEKIALETSKASLQSYFFQASTSIYQTVLAYWNYLAAHEKLRIYKTIELNTQKMLSDFEKLIEQGERPKTDANQIRANLASKHGQVVTGEKNLTTSAFNLAIAMGVTFEDAQLPPPEVKWARVNGGDILDVHAYINKALVERFDLKALHSEKRSAQLNVDSAKRSLKPELYIYASASYSETEEDHAASDLTDYPQTYAGGVVFSTYLGNRTAKSNVTQNEIALRKTELSLANSEREVSMDVASAVNELRKNLKTYEYAAMTVNLYHESLNVEERKLKLGMSTVIDVINIRESYQSALISQIEALRQVASSLAGVLYNTGGMITADGEKIFVNLPSLFALKVTDTPNTQQ